MKKSIFDDNNNDDIDDKILYGKIKMFYIKFLQGEQKILDYYNPYLYNIRPNNYYHSLFNGILTCFTVCIIICVILFSIFPNYRSLSFYALRIICLIMCVIVLSAFIIFTFYYPIVYDECKENEGYHCVQCGSGKYYA
jgi:hypothetical protein